MNTSMGATFILAIFLFSTLFSAVSAEIIEVDSSLSIGDGKFYLGVCCNGCNC